MPMCLVAVGTPACIIPLGPDFKDPPGAANSPPFIVSSRPDLGAIVIDKSFEVRVSDPNPGDDLYVLWYADFPPLQANTRDVTTTRAFIAHSADRSLQVTPLDATIDCQGNNLAAGIDQHTVTVFVSDVDFGPAGATTGFNGNHWVTATWSLLLQCPTSTTP